MKPKNSRIGIFSTGRFSLVVGILASFALACSLSVVSDTGAEQTLAAISLQATVQAQAVTQAALEQQNAQLAIQATQAALDRLKTEIAAQTPVVEQTEKQPTPSPEPVERTAEITATAEQPNAIPLTQFSGSGWLFVQSGQCKDRQQGCWLGTVKTAQFTTLTGQDQVFLNPAWPFPHLVFWTRYKSTYDFTFGYVELDVQGQVGYARVQSFGGTKDYWERVYIPLLDYAGNTVAVRFYFQGPDGTSAYQPSSFTWVLEDIQITPNFPQ